MEIDSRELDGLPLVGCPVCRAGVSVGRCWLCNGHGSIYEPIYRRWVADGSRAHADEFCACSLAHGRVPKGCRR